MWASLVAQLVKNPWFNCWVRKILWRRERLPTTVFLGFPGGSEGKESACNMVDLSVIPGLERATSRRAWQPTLIILPGESHGQRSLLGYSPCSRNNLRHTDNTTFMAESEEELKSLLIKVKEESEKVSLNLNIQKTKVMASGPITSW